MNLLRMIPDLILLGVIYYKLIFLNCRNQRSVLFRRTLLFMYLCVILYFTMMPVIAAIPQRFADSGFNYNFVLFVDWQMGRGAFRFETYANVLLFVPYGFLLYLCTDLSFWKAVFVGFLTSFLIEFFQPLVSSLRICDISDLITNTTGTLAGVLCAQIVSFFVRKRGTMKQ